MDVEPSKPKPLPWSAFERPSALGPLKRAAAETAPRPDPEASPTEATPHCGHGKVILLGEHAVVYGSHAIAAPIPLAVHASVRESGPGGVDLTIPRWGVTRHLDYEPAQPDILQRSLHLITEQLGLTGKALGIEVTSSVPRAMGLGSSAAFAVAVIRALDEHFRLGLDDAQVNVLAFRCEELAHGTPSGIDNTVATYGKLVLYRRGRETGEASQIRELRISHPLPLVIGISGRGSLTAQAVGDVRRAWQKAPARYEKIFQRIDAIVLQGVEDLQHNDLEHMGSLMNACHHQLQALDVSCPELDDLVRIARANGALGAKLTGGGKGGSIVALCPGNRARVMAAMREAGYQAMEVDLG